jgi:hypothetical protein
VAEFDFFIVGIGERQIASSSETRTQIEAVKALECDLEYEGESLSWDYFDDPEEPRTLFRSIYNDRTVRVDKGTPMARRPGFCVVTAMDGKAVRLEYYGGRNTVSLQYDIRAKELEGLDLPDFLDKDPRKKGSCVGLTLVKLRGKRIALNDCEARG